MDVAMASRLGAVRKAIVASAAHICYSDAAPRTLFERVIPHPKQSFASFSSIHTAPAWQYRPVRLFSSAHSGTHQPSFLRRVWNKLKWVPIPFGVGLAYLGYRHFDRVFEKPGTKRHPEEDMFPEWFMHVLKTFPTRVGSRVWGSVNEVDLPVWMRQPVLGLYSWAFNCNLSEAVNGDLSSYANLQKFFGRSLKEGVRPIESEAALVSPADSKVLHFGEASADGRIEQVKSVTYKVADFLGEQPPQCKPGNKLFQIVLYLAPGDYHHFHSPAQWSATVLRHCVGHLFSVSPIAARLVKELFVLNERVVLAGSWKHGFFSYTAVGAYNVGSIALDCAPELVTNTSQSVGEIHVQDVSQSQHNSYDVGSHIGAFRLGSTIVLVFEAPENFKFTVSANQKLKYGQAIGTF